MSCFVLSSALFVLSIVFVAIIHFALIVLVPIVDVKLPFPLFWRRVHVFLASKGIFWRDVQGGKGESKPILSGGNNRDHGTFSENVEESSVATTNAISDEAAEPKKETCCTNWSLDGSQDAYALAWSHRRGQTSRIRPATKWVMAMALLLSGFGVAFLASSGIVVYMICFQSQEHSGFFSLLLVWCVDLVYLVKFFQVELLSTGLAFSALAWARENDLAKGERRRGEGMCSSGAEDWRQRLWRVSVYFCSSPGSVPEGPSSTIHSESLMTHSEQGEDGKEDKNKVRASKNQRSTEHPGGPRVPVACHLFCCTVWMYGREKRAPSTFLPMCLHRKRKDTPEKPDTDSELEEIVRESSQKSMSSAQIERITEEEEKEQKEKTCYVNLCKCGSIMFWASTICCCCINVDQTYSQEEDQEDEDTKEDQTYRKLFLEGEYQSQTDLESSFQSHRHRPETGASPNAVVRDASDSIHHFENVEEDDVQGGKRQVYFDEGQKRFESFEEAPKHRESFEEAPKHPESSKAAPKHPASSAAAPPHRRRERGMTAPSEHSSQSHSPLGRADSRGSVGSGLGIRTPSTPPDRNICPPGTSPFPGPGTSERSTETSDLRSVSQSSKGEVESTGGVRPVLLHSTALRQAPEWFVDLRARSRSLETSLNASECCPGFVVTTVYLAAWGVASLSIPFFFARRIHAVANAPEGEYPQVCSALTWLEIPTHFVRVAIPAAQCVLFVEAILTRLGFLFTAVQEVNSNFPKYPREPDDGTRIKAIRKAYNIVDQLPAPLNDPVARLSSPCGNIPIQCCTAIDFVLSTFVLPIVFVLNTLFLGPGVHDSSRGLVAVDSFFLFIVTLICFAMARVHDNFVASTVTVLNHARTRLSFNVSKHRYNPDFIRTFYRDHKLNGAKNFLPTTSSGFCANVPLNIMPHALAIGGTIAASIVGAYHIRFMLPILHDITKYDPSY